MATKSRLLANKKFRDKAYDVITFEADKGKRDAYKRIAEELGLSLRVLIQNGVEAYAYACAGGEVNLPNQTAQVTQPAEQISATQRRLLDAVNQLSTDAQKSLLKFLQSLSKAENTAKNAPVDAQEPI